MMHLLLRIIRTPILSSSSMVLSHSHKYYLSDVFCFPSIFLTLWSSVSSFKFILSYALENAMIGIKSHESRHTPDGIKCIDGNLPTALRLPPGKIYWKKHTRKWRIYEMINIFKWCYIWRISSLFLDQHSLDLSCAYKFMNCVRLCVSMFRPSTIW